MAIESQEQRNPGSPTEPEHHREEFAHRLRLVERHRTKTIKDHVEGKLTWYTHHKSDETAIWVQEASKSEKKQLPAAAERIYQARKNGNTEELQKIMVELGGAVPYSLLSQVVDTLYPDLAAFETRAETNTLTDNDDQLLVTEATKSLANLENINPRRLALNLQMAGFTKEESARLAVKMAASQGAAWTWRLAATVAPIMIAAHQTNSSTFDSIPYPLQVAAAFALHAGVAYLSNNTVDADMHLLEETGFCPEPGKIIAKEVSQRLKPNDRQFQRNQVWNAHWGASLPPRIWEEVGYGVLNVASAPAAIWAHLYTAGLLAVRNTAEHAAADIAHDLHQMESTGESIEAFPRSSRAVKVVFDASKRLTERLKRHPAQINVGEPTLDE